MTGQDRRSAVDGDLPVGTANPAPPSGHPSVLRWIWVAIGACLIAPAALFVHDFMLESLKIPYPKIVGLPVWVTGMAVLAKLLAVVAFCRMSASKLRHVSPALAAIAIGLLMLMLHETGRVIVIEHSIYDSWAVALLDGAPAAIALFLEVSIVAYACLNGVHWRRMLVLIAAVTVIGAALLSPWLVAHLGSVRDIDYKDVKELYTDPYPPFLNVIIYTAFIEPTAAAFAFAILCWDGLTGSAARRVAIFTMFLLLIRGRFVLELVSSFWVQQPLPTAFLATGQFFLETMVLALLVGAAWALLRPRGSSRSLG